MSLDVYLIGAKPQKRIGSGIFVREGGQTKEISRAEWDAKHPDLEPVMVEGWREAYHANITHNLGMMAAEAGIYKHLWRPEEIGITKAGQLIEPLGAALALLKSDPERFKKFNPENGWGSYEMFVPWVEDYLAACKANPEASIEVSR